MLSSCESSISFAFSFINPVLDIIRLLVMPYSVVSILMIVSIVMKNADSPNVITPTNKMGVTSMFLLDR